jgi:putative endonuclease
MRHVPRSFSEVGQMYYVYLLKLNNSEYYAGSTANLESRVSEHEKGKNKSTKLFRPVELVWSASFKTRKLAENFEKYLKSSSGFAFRNKRLI